MTEVLICLERPASLTPELRAWIGQRPSGRRAALSRGHPDESGHAPLLLRVELTTQSEAAAEDEVAELMTDLRLLGLRPTLLAEQAV